MFESVCVDDRFETLVADSLHLTNHSHNKKVTNIMILPPTILSCPQHKVVTSITVTITGLSRNFTISLRDYLVLLDFQLHPLRSWSNPNQ